MLKKMMMAAVVTMASVGAMAQMDAPKKAAPSPAATASVTLAGKAVNIAYSAPSMRGRVIMGGLVPYGTIWRTGANAATTLTTATDLKIGSLKVPAGTYTLYTLPTEGKWMLVVSKQTGQWGTVYTLEQDLGRTEMKKEKLAAPQEVMSISFDKTEGKHTQLHIRWENTDVWVHVEAE